MACSRGHYRSGQCTNEYDSSASMWGMAVDVPQRLINHLETWLGAWPTQDVDGVTVVGSDQRIMPGWDTIVHQIVGVATPSSAVLSVPTGMETDLQKVVGTGSLTGDLDALNHALPEVMGFAGHLGAGLFRYSMNPTDTPDAGEWIATTDVRVPPWLTPFNGDVLIAWDDEGRYGGGVGRKQHDRFGHELSVGTEESLRGRGIGRRLVATAARRVLDDGAIPTYLHAPDNYASAKVADAAGFPDIGWKILGFWGSPG
jgi:GNAT superfamily N-acetyltransferase